jgi:fructose/tagatose bisphosphate aldolase
LKEDDVPIITNRHQVLAIYAEAAQNGWVLPCFCSENLTTTEAVLAATLEHSRAIGRDDLPVIVAITNQYDHRTQSAYYTHTRRWDLGLRLFLADLQILARPDSPFGRLRIMIHLDHIQFDDDRELLHWDLSPFSSIMFDASKVPFADNIRLTREFVREHGSHIVVEGACDEIVDAGGTVRSELTTAEHAVAYMTGTGVDLIVANLGTEHRASGRDLMYHGERAREIKARIGNRIVLHGASSVLARQIAELFADGVCKVNIWTALERDAAPQLLCDMVENACKVAGPAPVNHLKAEGLLGVRCSADGKASLSHFTTVYRQDIIFAAMKNLVLKYFQLWYRDTVQPENQGV